MNDNNNIVSKLDSLSMIKPYKRALLIDLAAEKEKGVYMSSDCIPAFTSKFTFPYTSVNLKYLSFYYYDCESVHDFGWGCAWRAIQTCLSYLLSRSSQLTSSTDITFKNLFITYGARSKLEALYIKTYQPDNPNLPDYISNRNFCPFESMDGWAEPFIGKLIMSDYGFEGELLLINSYNEKAYAPKEVFSRIITFPDFVEMVKEHFSKEDASPIMIDDSITALCIGGIGKEETDGDDSIRFIILDPHVRNDKKGEQGIYYIIIEKNGEYKISKNKQETILGGRLRFDTKGWMVFIPKNNK